MKNFAKIVHRYVGDGAAAVLAFKYVLRAKMLHMEAHAHFLVEGRDRRIVHVTRKIQVRQSYLQFGVERVGCQRQSSVRDTHSGRADEAAGTRQLAQVVCRIAEKNVEHGQPTVVVTDLALLGNSDSAVQLYRLLADKLS